MDKNLILSIIILVVGSLFIIATFIHAIISNNQMHEYCINEGYEGLANLNTGLKDFRCYKYVKHESDLGSEIVYSGIINYKDVKRMIKNEN